MASNDCLSESEVDVLSSNLFPKIINNARLLETIRANLAMSRSLQGTLDAVLASFAVSEDEKAQLSLLLLLNRLSNYSIGVVIFCLSQSQLAGIASGSIKSQKELAAHVVTVPAVASDIPRDCQDAWAKLRRRLFALEPTAMVLGLARSGNLPLPDGQRDVVVSVLEVATEKFNFNIAKESIRALLDGDGIKAEVPGAHQDQWPVARRFLFQLQRLQALVNEPEDIGALVKCGYNSAEELSRSGDSSVKAMVMQGIPEKRAVQIRNHAAVVSVRSEDMWTTALKARDAKNEANDSLTAVTSVSSRESGNPDADEPPLAPEINFTAMFGLESMGCEDCASVTGPAAYFVDLLQTLKSIKLRDPSLPPGSPTPPDSPTLLDKLFARRPDMGNLQLSCSNTNVLIPYIDLVNEVLDIIAQPRHINYPVYSDFVQKKVYPMDRFPYNHAIDSIRAYLTALGSSRYQFLSSLQSINLVTDNVEHSSQAQEVLDRSLAAEALGLQHEDYVAICREGFYSLDFLRTLDPSMDEKKYVELIGLMTAGQYWGYKDDAAMVNPTGGLTNITEQLLPRSGLNFQDLLDILKTSYINGRLVIISAKPKEGGPEFTGELSDMRLRLLLENGTTDPLNADICWQLQAFVRLRQKLQWPIEELDAVAVPLAQSRTTSFDPELLNGLAAVKQIAELSDISPTELQPLWGDINTHGPKSLYAQYFLKGPIPPSERKVFEPDANGEFLQGDETIADYIHTLALALRVNTTSLNAIITSTGLADRLSLHNVSFLYRVSVLCQILEISPADYTNLLELYPEAFDPFESPKTTLGLIKEVKALLSQSDPWTLDQLMFVTKGKSDISDSQHNLGVENILQVAVSLFANIKASGAISGSVDVDGIPETDLAERVQQVAGQLLGIQTGIKASEYINRSPVKQDEGTLLLITQYLAVRIGLLDAQRVSEELSAAGKTTHDRQKLFLETTVPLLPKTQQRQIIIDSLKPQVEGIGVPVLQFALSEVVQVSSTVSPQEVKSGMDVMLLLAGNTELDEGNFEGRFLPSNTDIYIIYIETAETDSPPGNLFIDGAQIDFSKTLDPNAPWAATTGPLVGGRSYRLAFTGNVKALRWTTQQAVGVPSVGFNKETLIPETVVSDITTVLLKLMRMATVIAYFGLDISEIAFWQSSQILDFNAPSYENVQELQLYSLLKNEFSRNGAAQPLISLYQWLHNHEAKGGTLVEILTAVTAWPKRVCEDFLKSRYPNLESNTKSLLDVFREVRTLFEMRESLRFVDKLDIPSVSLSTLFNIAAPAMPPTVKQDFEKAAALRLGVQSRFNGTKAGGGAKTVLATANDQVRGNSRDVLVQYLLAMDYAKEKKLTHPDKLFAHFLIDVQMGPTLQTSRIKQAISTIQLFVQRCMLGAEKENGITGTLLMGRADWEYIMQYRLWEANRKSFLYPENWLDPTLRDDKTDQFKAIESKILQEKLDNDVIRDIVQDYVYEVNDTADLQVEAYFWDREDKDDDDNYKSVFHFFGRTRTSPPVYYYRQLDLGGMATNIIAYWTPWSKLDLDVAVHESDADGRKLSQPGSYFIPANISGRLLVFLPEITLGQQPQNSSVFTEETFESLSKKPINTTQADRQWEIRLGFIEYRNGAWSSKRISQSIITVPQESSSLGKQLPAVSSFKFWPKARKLEGSDVEILTIRVERLSGLQSNTPTIPDGARLVPDTHVQVLGEFELRDQHLVLVGPDKLPVSSYSNTSPSSNKTLPTVFSRLDWPVPKDSPNRIPVNSVHNGQRDVRPLLGMVTRHKDSKTLYKWTMSFDTVNNIVPTGLVFDLASVDDTKTYFAFPPQYLDSTPRRMSFTPKLVRNLNLSKSLVSVYETLSKLPENQYLEAFGRRNSNIYHELSTAFAIHNWELGVHIPSLLLERLIANQQFELALDVARLVFDPAADGDRVDRCWSFPPFRDERIRKGKGPDFDLEWKKKMTAEEWRASKFSVHAAARGNPVAYMKRIAIKYIEILITEGDNLFRQNTFETLPLAIHRYTEASHVFGPPPVEIPPLGKRAVKTYNQIAKDLDAFSNATIDMELDFPFYSEPGQRGYFCVPANPNIVSLHNLIDDRLYKIRNGMDIDGNARTLALWEAPIDPGALVRANALGGADGLSNLLASLNGPIPKQRFSYLIKRAFEFVDVLKVSAQQLLAIREKKDAEALTVLRSQHRKTVLKLATDIREAQKKEIQRAMESLEEKRKQQEMRLRFYLDITGDDKQAPQPGESWQDIKQIIQPPTKDDFRLSPYEQEEFDQAGKAFEAQKMVANFELAASALFGLPSFSAEIEPFGVGATASYGGDQLGNIPICIASAHRAEAEKAASDSSTAAFQAQVTRRLQKRRLKANTIGREIVKLDKDMEQLRARVETCEARMKLQQQRVENAEAEEQWLQSKYTTQQLYSTLDSSLSSLFHQTYKMASEVTSTAQRALDFEHSMRYPNSNAPGSTGSFLENNLRDGYFIGEALYLDLKRMEATHMDNRPHDLEIHKTVSLRQLDAWAFLELRESGVIEFDLPEAIFDMDFPGHYCRRIFSVELTIPDAGPHTSQNCKLSLRSHRYRVSPLVGNAEAYNAAADREIDDGTTFHTDLIPITSVAFGTGGQFNFSSTRERYGPFEGAGAISRWSLRLPPTLRAFDYNDMSDLLLHVRYTALDGGDALARIADEALRKRISTGDDAFSVAAIDLVKDYPDEWRACIESDDPAALLSLTGLQSRTMPVWTRLGKVTAENIALLVAPEPGALNAEVVVNPAKSVMLERTGAPDVGDYYVVASQSAEVIVADEWKIKGLAGQKTLTKAWFVIGFTVSGLK
ncbi:Toxin subunit YenA2-like protein [Cladobotryum mycophilum]|uniref:Toxin subunit YenA2-like protein n=1 Tax=Cladobotryum mycophilum TaxID=491253 RepID=A0ABR0SL45_9HYPO